MRKPSLDDYDRRGGRSEYWAARISFAAHAPYDEEGAAENLPRPRSMREASADASRAAARYQAYQAQLAIGAEERREAAERSAALRAKARHDQKLLAQAQFEAAMARARMMDALHREREERARRWKERARRWKEEARLWAGEVKSVPQWGAGHDVLITKKSEVRWNQWPASAGHFLVLNAGEHWVVGERLAAALIANGMAERW